MRARPPPPAQRSRARSRWRRGGPRRGCRGRSGTGGARASARPRHRPPPARTGAACPAAHEGLNVVKGAGGVEGHALVPPGAVQLAHALSVSFRGPCWKPSSMRSPPPRSPPPAPRRSAPPQARDAPAAHGIGQRLERGPQPAVVRVAQRHQALAAALDVEHRLGVERHHVGPGHARGPPRLVVVALGPGQGCAVRVGGIGHGEHQRAPASRRSAWLRSRSIAAGSANCAPPRPSTK